MSKRSRRRAGGAKPPLPSSALSAGERHRLLVEAIVGGVCDDGLGALAEAIDARRRLLRTAEVAAALAHLGVGDEVRINETVKPRYLHGVCGTVSDVDGEIVGVCLHRPVGRFTSGQVRCSALALQRLDDVTVRGAA